MNDNIHLEANVVAVNRADLIPPSSISEQTQSKVLGAATKSNSGGSVLMYATVLCAVVIITLLTLKYHRK